MGLSRIISEIDGDFSRKLQKKNFNPVYFAPPLTGFSLEMGIGAAPENTRWS